MLAESDLPPGVSFPSDNLPVILGAPGNLRLERIGLDDTGALSADITQEWKPSNHKEADRKSESLTGLKIGSTFTRKYSWGTCDYRVMQIIAPDPKHHVPGWIGVRPVPGTRHGGWSKCRSSARVLAAT